MIALGNALEDRQDFAGALARYREAAMVDPTNARALLNVANALRATQDRSGALAALSQALALSPDYAEAHFNLGLLRAESGDAMGARIAFDETLRLKPDLAERVIDAQSYLLFNSSMRDINESHALAQAHFSAGAQISALAGRPFEHWPNDSDSQRRLRLGYMSGDLGVHPVGMFLKTLLPLHDSTKSEIYCYSNNEPRDPVHESVSANVDHVVSIFELDDDAVSERIRHDAIDVLIDLSGHTERNRLGVFARHPAPVQATWLGYLNTTGLRAMDYRICDRFTDPVGASEALHTERLYRMPHSQWCYGPWCDTPTQPSPGPRTASRLVYGSCNQIVKISEACLDLWCEVLRNGTTIDLEIFDVRSEQERSSISSRLQQRGIDPQRLTLRDRMSVSDYYRAVSVLDVALDTYPYNGGTTTLDTLWMGVPIVALRGELGISRSSYSILSNLGLPTLIARSKSQYVDLNLRLAFDHSWRRSLRDGMREKMLHSPLMDVRGFVADLEAAYRTMWREWCERQPTR